MFIIPLQNYRKNCQEHILMNAIIYQMHKKMNSKYKPKELFIKGYDYNDWYKNVEQSDKEESSDKEETVNLSDMSPLECDEEEVKEGEGLKILTTDKQLIRFTTLLAQIKAGKNSYKLKNEIRKILYLLYQYNKITKKVYNNLIKSL